MSSVVEDGTRVTIIKGPIHLLGARGTILEIISGSEIKVRLDQKHVAADCYRERIYSLADIRPLNSDELEHDQLEITSKHPVCENIGCEHQADSFMQLHLSGSISFEIWACDGCRRIMESLHKKRVTFKIYESA